MAKIQWRPERNQLTTPPSYRPLFIPRNVVSKAEMAARMAKEMPNYSEAEFRAFIDLHNKIIMDSLINGEQVTEENAFTYRLAFTGRMESPDDPLPPLDKCLHVRVSASTSLSNAVRQKGQTERLQMVKKEPMISTAQDTVLGLKDVLHPNGLIRLTGENLFFDLTKPGAGECVIEGTAGDRIVQSRFGKVEDREIIFAPEIPAQSFPWNNEHTISISTRYSARGTLRTGTYSRKLRSPLTVNGFGDETGILTGSADSPYVSITGGSASADETLRIQVLIDLRTDELLFSLLDMQEEGGRTGAPVRVTGNGALTLQGFAGSALSSLALRVDSFAALKDMIHDSYGSRLTDILEVRTA